MYQNKNNRWNKWNYSNNGFYFITICTGDRYPYFGNIENDKMILNNIGIIVKNKILNIENFHKTIIIHEYCIMPNHLHFIFEINKNCDVGARLIWHLRERNNQLLSLIIGLFKSSASREINKIKPYYFKWQKSFHDHIIRNEIEYLKIKRYIINNPKMWNGDRNNK